MKKARGMHVGGFGEDAGGGIEEKGPTDCRRALLARRERLSSVLSLKEES
jgi:hypothetical protein